jgi:hypothetical protein
VTGVTVTDANNNQSIDTYKYDGNGTMTRSIIGDITTYYPSGVYQVKTDSTHWNVRKYYSFGASTVAMLAPCGGALEKQ